MWREHFIVLIEGEQEVTGVEWGRRLPLVKRYTTCLEHGDTGRRSQTGLRAESKLLVCIVFISLLVT